MRDDNVNKKLFRLSELDEYKVAEGDPDVRGWRFVDRDHDRLGKVQDLIVDPDKKKVRYLDVVLDKEFSHSDGERHILVPIGLAKVHENHDDVLLNEIDRDKLLEFPVYTGPGVTLDYEHALAEKLHTDQTNTERSSEEFYTIVEFDSDSFYGPRRTVTRKR